MNRPSFQFYPKDWRTNSKLRRCSPAARGVWIDVMCALHDSDDYGVARYPLVELANEIGASIRLLHELADKGVLKGDDKLLAEDFVYVPRSGRKDGEPVVLLPTQPGPIWYSSRMVKDEYVRTIRGEGTRFGDPDGAASKVTGKPSPKPPKGDGPSSSSSSSPPGEEIPPASQAPQAVAGSTPSRGSRLPADWHPGESGFAFASQHGLANGKASAELEKFRDHWAAKAGKDGARADWQATWRNWVRKAIEFAPVSGRTTPGGDDPFKGAI